jgi:putative transposase
VAHDVRDQVLGFVRRWSGKTAIGVGAIHSWLGVTASKFYIGDSVTVVSTNTTVGFPVILGWSCGKGSDHRFPFENRLEGYRQSTFMMLDADVVAVSAASVRRVLKQAGLLSRSKTKPWRKWTGFEQPLRPHQHWHIDVSYINLCGTFNHLCSVLTGSAGFLVHWDFRESMRFRVTSNITTTFV